jgi:hypothetical protein
MDECSYEARKSARSPSISPFCGGASWGNPRNGWRPRSSNWNCGWQILRKSRAEQRAKQPEAHTPDPVRRKPRKPAIRKPLPPHLTRETVVHEPQIFCVCGDLRPVLADLPWRRRHESAGEDPRAPQGNPPCPLTLCMPQMQGRVPGAGARLADIPRPAGARRRGSLSDARDGVPGIGKGRRGIKVFLLLFFKKRFFFF